MRLNHLTKLFTVGLLATALVGCSSTPKSQDDADNMQGGDLQQVGGSGVETSSANLGMGANATELEKAKANLAKNVVRFEFDRSDVSAEFYSTISAHADFMSANPSTNVTVTGHCDERGTREYNLALGERRALAVKSALVAVGVNPDRIDVVSYGEDSPVAMGHNESAWSQNRRAEFKY